MSKAHRKLTRQWRGKRSQLAVANGALASARLDWESMAVWMAVGFAAAGDDKPIR